VQYLNNIIEQDHRAIKRRVNAKQLHAQGSIFDGDGLVTAQQESDESKDRQEKGWHAAFQRKRKRPVLTVVLQLPIFR
jgi:transposase-like protein